MVEKTFLVRIKQTEIYGDFEKRFMDGLKRMYGKNVEIYEVKKLNTDKD